MARRRAEQTTKPTGSLVAAAARINLNDKISMRGAGPKPKDWQAEGWAFFDEVPEVKFGVRFLGNAFAKLKLYAAVRPAAAKPDADPIPIGDTEAGSDIDPELAAAATAELARLRGVTGGQSALQARLNMNFEVAGECWLVGWAAKPESGERGTSDYQPATPESWQVCSVSEVIKKSGKWIVLGEPGDKKGRALGDDDTIIRLWEQHPQWSAVADCAMRGVLSDCKALQVFAQQQYAEGLSRQSAGVLLVPNELSTGPASPTEPDDDSEPADPFIEALMAALTAPIEDPSAASSVVPLVVRGNADALDKFRHVLLGRQSDGVLDQRMQARIERIARGLNLPVEVVMGHQQTTYANAEQVDQDTFEDHLEPRCQLVADALTVGFLRPNLLDSYPDKRDAIERICVWYDASALVRQPDTEAAANEAHDRFAISDAAYRKARGFTEDDAADDGEILLRAGLRRGILTAELTAALIRSLADEAGVELPSPQELAPGGPPTADAEATAQLVAALIAAGRPRATPAPTRVLDAVSAATTRPRWNPGAPLTAIDRELRTRLVVSADASMTRALERAGAKMRAKAGKELQAVVRTVDNLHVAPTLGARVASGFVTSDELLDGAWDNLQEQFMQWGANAQADALDVASRAVSGLTDAERASLALRQADDLDAAWRWLSEAMTALANTVMFNPDPSVPEVGEFDPSSRVPAGMLRQAVARAGGAGGLVMPDSGGAYITLADAGTRPAGGIGTGELIGSTLRDHGVGIEGYRWVYGPAHRKSPFLPHRDLDGIEFVNFDDDVLANYESFPEFAFYMPGDHDGCVCDVEPVIIPADEA